MEVNRPRGSAMPKLGDGALARLTSFVRWDGGWDRCAGSVAAATLSWALSWSIKTGHRAVVVASPTNNNIYPAATRSPTRTRTHPLTMQSISTRVFALVAIVFVFVASVNAAAIPVSLLLQNHPGCSLTAWTVQREPEPEEVEARDPQGFSARW